MRTHKRTYARRAAFTLAELLMVIVIITVIAGMAFVAVMRFSDAGPYQATVSNLGKVKGTLDAQWKAVRDQAMKSPMDDVTSMDDIGAVSKTDGLARQKYTDYKLKQAFPISFAEALNPVMVSGKAAQDAYPAYDTYLRGLLSINLNKSLVNGKAAADLAKVCAPPDVQQAICLMMILERGPNSSGNADRLGTSVVQRLDLVDSTPSKKPVQANGIVDAWGRPFFFTRNYNPNVTSGPSGNANTLAVVSAGALKGKSYPWDRLRIDGATPKLAWVTGAAWEPTPSKHDLGPYTPDDKDQIVSSYSP